MVGKKKGLGPRGLDSLIPKAKTAGSSDGSLTKIPVEFIQRGRYQPRSHFEEEAMQELADSIKAQGVMQPVVVRPLSADKYELIAGERRWRAAQIAGLDKVPAVVREVNDEAALALSLIENIQREDLNPMEEAIALKRLVDEFQYTHEEVAEAVGKSRSAVTNLMRLSHLPESIASLLATGALEMGHARALLTLDAESQLAIAQEIVKKGLNVRQAEELVRNRGKPKAEKPPGTVDRDTQRLEENLGSQLGQPVQIRHTKKGKGKLIINYNTLDELDGILSRMGYEET